MINRQHFKATPLANILKRAMNVTPLDEERNKVEVLGDVLKNLHISPKDTNQVRRVGLLAQKGCWLQLSGNLLHYVSGVMINRMVKSQLKYLVTSNKKLRFI